MPAASSRAERRSGRAATLTRAALAGALRLVYPPQCLCCEAAVHDEGNLCAACWRDTPFIAGTICDRCGTPLPGHPDEGAITCDDCRHVARPWSRGRAALIYGEKAREIVLGLKYRDRHDSARPAGRWLARVAAPLIRPDTMIAPVPLHRWRLFRRRFNQAALLSGALARETGRPHSPDLLIRTAATGTQDGRSREGRFANLAGAIRVHPGRAARIEGRHVLLVDDVMTSGATLAACTEACFAAGADDVDVVVLARVTRET